MSYKKLQKNEQVFIINNEDGLDNCLFSLIPGDRVFFYGDLGSGKTTFIRHLLKKELDNSNLLVRSPSYTYYEEYIHPVHHVPIYHFDLYRIEEYSTFVSIGGEEILENPNNIILIEWPEVIKVKFQENISVSINMDTDTKRNITVSQNRHTIQPN